VEGERPLVVTEEYERLGGKKLSLIDVLAQSVGFMGPVFSAAFIIPLIIGVNAAAIVDLTDIAAENMNLKLY